MSELLHWMLEAPKLVGGAFALSLVLLLGGLLLVPLVLTRMPADHFVRSSTAPAKAPSGHPLLRGLLRLLRNLLGVLLLVSGVAMLVLPGQGILTIFAALTLLEFPGKRRVELALVREPHVLQLANWLRERAGAAPLELPARRERPR